MQSKQVDSERLRTRQLPQTQPTPHASLDNIQLFSSLETRNSYLINRSPY